MPLPEPLAFYDPGSSSWRTYAACLPLTEGEPSDVFSGTWPASGTTRSGRCYARPTPAHPTGGPACSSLLPTPMTEPMTGNGHARNLGREVSLPPTPDAYEGSRGGSQKPEKRRAGGHAVSLQDVAEHLLPTPRATRGGSATETTALLPTPRATDGSKGGPNQRGSSGDLMLPSAVLHLLRPGLDTLARSSWIGASTSPRSDDGSEPSDVPRPGQLSLDATDGSG